MWEAMIYVRLKGSFKGPMMTYADLNKPEKAKRIIEGLIEDQ